MQTRITVALTQEQGEAVRLAAFNARVSKNRWVVAAIQEKLEPAPQTTPKPKKTKV